MQKHSAYRLTYALNETGQLVNVDDVLVGKNVVVFVLLVKEPLTAKNQREKANASFCASIRNGM